MLVARKEEQRLLRAAAEDEYSQFVAVYGRRRVGKTFLVRETFDYAFTFQHAGLAKGSLREQLSAFVQSLEEAGLRDFEPPRSWLDAFGLLKKLIRQSGDERKLVFIDELSWMDTPRSGLVTALENFWNGWASARKDVVLIVSASATSWMLSKVVHNKGGLYNRLTLQIHLEPFTLGECEELLRARGIVANRHQVLEYYMIFGGVPYYWTLLKRGRSVSQNVDALFFGRNAPLGKEFDYLYAALFKNPADYLKIVAALGRRKAGMTREEIISATGVANGELTTKLDELESCDFIRRFGAFGKKKKGAVFQLVDNFTLFYYKFLEDRPADEHYWQNQENSAQRNAWCGIAFERVCLQHVAQVKRALGISGVLTDTRAWSCAADPDKGVHGSQIDLLIVRRDQVINVCEMKFTRDEYAITKSTDEDIRHKVNDLQMLTKTRYAVHPVLVTTYGLAYNEYCGSVQAVITADDLFAMG